MSEPKSSSNPSPLSQSLFVSAQTFLFPWNNYSLFACGATGSSSCLLSHCHVASFNSPWVEDTRFTLFIMFFTLVHLFFWICCGHGPPIGIFYGFVDIFDDLTLDRGNNVWGLSLFVLWHTTTGVLIE